MSARERLCDCVWFLMKMFGVVSLCALSYVIVLINSDDRVTALMVYGVVGLLCTPAAVGGGSREEVEE